MRRTLGHVLADVHAVGRLRQSDGVPPVSKTAHKKAKGVRNNIAPWLGGAGRYFSDMQDTPDFLKSIDQTRRLSTREGWCRAHIEAIQVAIDQYAEAAFGNCDFFS